jgi:hypothetical protein
MSTQMHPSRSAASDICRALMTSRIQGISRHQHTRNILRRLWSHFRLQVDSFLAHSRSSEALVSHLCYPRPECDSPSVGKKACKPALQHRDHVPTTSIRLQSISKLAMPSPTPFTQMAQMRPIVILPLAKIGASTFMLCHFLNRYTTLLIYDSLSTSGQQCVSHDWQL